MTSNIKQHLLQAPESQLDSSMFALIEGWDDDPTSLQVLEVLDKCVHASLASGFVIKLLETLYDTALKREEKTHKDNVPLATWRKEM